MQPPRGGRHECPERPGAVSSALKKHVHLHSLAYDKYADYKASAKKAGEDSVAYTTSNFARQSLR
jgi:hypothetical protein